MIESNIRIELVSLFVAFEAFDSFESVVFDDEFDTIVYGVLLDAVAFLCFVSVLLQ